MQAIVIGRHAGEIPGMEVIEQRAVTFPETARECAPILEELVEAARAASAALLFQAVPGQLAVALAARAALNAWESGLEGSGAPSAGGIAYGAVPIGVIVSKPGPRPATVVNTYRVAPSATSEAELDAVAQLVTAINPNARIMRAVDGLRVEVDPPMRFEFSHIEWLNKPEPKFVRDLA